jgi:hypothetical protein
MPGFALSTDSAGSDGILEEDEIGSGAQNPRAIGLHTLSAGRREKFLLFNKPGIPKWRLFRSNILIAAASAQQSTPK